MAATTIPPNSPATVKRWGPPPRKPPKKGPKR
jgi:hypothetical protein